MLCERTDIKLVNLNYFCSPAIEVTEYMGISAVETMKWIAWCFFPNAEANT